MWPWRCLIVVIIFFSLHWLQCSLLWLSMRYQRLRPCITWWNWLLWTQIEVIDYVRYIGNSICIFLLFSQFVWKLRSSCIRSLFVWHSWRSDLSTRVGLWMSWLHLLIDNWIIWSVNLELVCVMWWFRNFNILTFHLNFWCMLMCYLLFAVFGYPRID